MKTLNTLDFSTIHIRFVTRTKQNLKQLFIQLTMINLQNYGSKSGKHFYIRTSPNKIQFDFLFLRLTHVSQKICPQQRVIENMS